MRERLTDREKDLTVPVFLYSHQIPEGDEQFVLQLSAPDGGAQSGFPMVATITITENDNPVEFKGLENFSQYMS